MKRFLVMLAVAVLAASMLGACGEKVEEVSFEKIETVADEAQVNPPEETKTPSVSEEAKTEESVSQPEPEPEPVEEPVATDGNEWFTSVVSAGAMSQSQVSLTWKNSKGDAVGFKDGGGKLYLIDVWAEWCPPCRMSTPTMIDMHNKYKDRGLIVIGLNVDSQDALFKAQEFAQNEGITYPVIHDPKSSKISGIFVGQGIPTFTLVDSEGTVHFTNEGAITGGSEQANQLESIIKAKLGL